MAFFAWFTPVHLARLTAEAAPPCPEDVVAAVDQADIETYIAEMLDRGSANNARKHYASLQQFFRWAEDEGLTDASPMLRTSPPFVPTQPVPVVSDSDLIKLTATCERGPVRHRTFENLRDAAIIRLFLDGGPRLDELSGLSLGDLEFDMDVAHVMGKGRRLRAVPFGAKTGEALRRYLRARANHRVVLAMRRNYPMDPKKVAEAEASEPLWIGKFGPMTPSGVAQMIERRCGDAGIKRINPHKFRHTWATDLVDSGASQSDVKRLGGWKTDQMVDRYTSTTADKRARESHRRLARGDRL